MLVNVRQSCTVTDRHTHTHTHTLLGGLTRIHAQVSRDVVKVVERAAALRAAGLLPTQP